MEIRLVTADDYSDLEAFSCQDYSEPWTVIAEEMVRMLSVNLQRGFVSAAGLWLSDQLSGVAAWDHDDTGPIIVRSIVVAVRNGARRRGIASALKQHVLAVARESGAIAVVSTVHWDNEPMLRLNKKFGANIERIPGDRDYCRCIIPLRTRPETG